VNAITNIGTPRHAWRVFTPPPERASIEQGYERWASVYDDFPNPILAREERYLLPLLPSLAGKRALDIGCGTGRWLQRLAGRGARQLIGVDLSAAMLQRAQAKNLVQSEVLRADCLQLPFSAYTFDFSICSFVISHVRDLHHFAHELARVMKPRSDFFVTDLHFEAFAVGWRTGFRDHGGAVEIEVFPRHIERVLQVFIPAGFECLTHVALCLGEAEKPIFDRANRSTMFDRACRVPAISFAHFRRTACHAE